METLSILLATDGSPKALAAAQWLNRYANPQRARITLVTVMHPPSTAWTVGAGGYVLDVDIYQKTFQEMVEEERADAQEALIQTQNYLHQCPPVASEVLIGSPAAMIVDYATNHGMDLIVMGRRGHSALGNLVGSVSFSVLQRSPMPVTFVG